MPLGLLCIRGITAAFALEVLQAAVEGVEAGASGFEPISHQHGLVEATFSAQVCIPLLAEEVILSTVNKVLAEMCKDVRISTTPDCISSW